MDNKTVRTTDEQIEEVLTVCRNLYLNKLKDYGASWRIMRPESLTDQIYIKASRIRTLHRPNVKSRIDEGIVGEFIAIINYGLMAQIQLSLEPTIVPDLDLNQAEVLYEQTLKSTLELLKDKNHDYGEAWRKMRVSSITDLILTKIYRIKQIEDNSGATLVSEGVGSNYMDIVNYAIFALILLSEDNVRA